MNPKPLVENAGIFKTIAVMLFCHASVTFLCANVMFDLVIFGLPLFFLKSIRVVPSKIYFNLMTILINWTTPIVYGIPMVFSGTKVYIDNIDIIIESKRNNSLLLANHGSRVDWMVAMFIGHLNKLSNEESSHSTCRVGFVCEALIQMMPLIGWYRKIICDDIFVWRSFDKDEGTIRGNIASFHQCEEQRMLFLSPEGVVVDHGEKDMEYVHQCRQFCIDYGMKPFEYVLTPRYKGTKCLLDQVRSKDGGKNGIISSACLVFIRDGKLLNCKLLSSERIIPDIYDLNQGIAGRPISIYVHVRRQNGLDGEHKFDAKARLMEEYAWKDSILSQWDKLLQKDIPQDGGAKFTFVETDKKEVLMSHLYHLILMVSILSSLNMMQQFTKVCQCIFLSVSITHTLGWLVNKSSMESVPFETGIKALVTFLMSFQSDDNLRAGFKND